MDLVPSDALIKLVDSGFWHNGWDGAEKPIARRSKANGRGPGGKPLEPGMQGWVIVPVEPQPCKRSDPGIGRHVGNRISSRRKPIASRQMTVDHLDEAPGLTTITFSRVDPGFARLGPTIGMLATIRLVPGR